MSEKRKIQKTGSSSYAVSLPKSWVKKNSVKSGDFINISEEKDQSLRLSLHEISTETKEIVLNISNYAEEVEVLRRVISYYIDGASKVTLVHNQPLTGKFMKKVIFDIRKLIGFEIVEDTDSKVIFQDFFTSKDLSITKAIKRAFSISNLIISESQKILNKKDGQIENIDLWEDEMNKVHLLIRRQINRAIHNSQILKKLDISLADAQIYLLLIGAIEKLTDIFVDIAKSGSDILGETQENINTIYDEVLKIYNMAFSSISLKDFSLTNETIKKNEEFSMKIVKIMQKDKGINQSQKTSYVVLNLFSATRLIEEITELGLDVVS